MNRLKWEERWHPLRREWVIFAAHRQDRPWSGITQQPAAEPLPAYDPKCYLCPGNRRINGAMNAHYSGVFVFANDHPCVGDWAPTQLAEPLGVYRNQPAGGVARVVCYHPQHNLSLCRLTVEQVVELLTCWQQQYEELCAHPDVNHVLIFENRGAVVGVSNPHPHGQIYATNFIFKTIENEALYAREHFSETGGSLLGDMIDAEQCDGRRIIAERDQAIGFLPYCARYAYETFVAPLRAAPTLAALNVEELRDFADVLLEVVIRMENLWQMPFPYVMVLHQAPTDGRDHPGFHFHIELHPPLRKPDLLKYLAGPEIGGGGFLSDTWPEDKAAELRAKSNVHYADQAEKNAGKS